MPCAPREREQEGPNKARVVMERSNVQTTSPLPDVLIRARGTFPNLGNAGYICSKFCPEWLLTGCKMAKKCCRKIRFFWKEGLKELSQGKHFLLPLLRALWLCKDVQQLLLLSCQVPHNLLWSGALQMPVQNSLKKQIPAYVNQSCKLKDVYKSQHTFITPFICEQYLRVSILTS